MKNQLKLSVLALVCSAATLAAEGMKIQVNGSAEAGLSYSFQPDDGTGATKETQMAVDDVTMNLTADVSEKTKVVVTNSFAVSAGTRRALTAGYPTTAFAEAFNSNNYYSAAILAAGRLAFANNGAYISHKCTDGIHAWVGHFKTPFGMESLTHRYDQHSYYYSTAYNAANAMNWNYDTGINVNFKDVFPGTLDAAIIDGRDHPATAASGVAQSGNHSTPGLVVRYAYDYNAGDWTLTPVASVYASTFIGGPKNFGYTAGLMWKMGTIWANAEWVQTGYNIATGADGKAKIRSVYIEPGIDLGMVNLSVKADFNQTKTIDTGADTSTNDWELGAALSKTFEGGYRMRILYNHANFSKKAGRAGNDIRILFGTKW